MARSFYVPSYPYWLEAHYSLARLDFLSNLNMYMYFYCILDVIYRFFEKYNMLLRVTIYEVYLFLQNKFQLSRSFVRQGGLLHQKYAIVDQFF